MLLTRAYLGKDLGSVVLKEREWGNEHLIHVSRETRQGHQLYGTQHLLLNPDSY